MCARGIIAMQANFPNFEREREYSVSLLIGIYRRARLDWIFVSSVYESPDRIRLKKTIGTIGFFSG